MACVLIRRQSPLTPTYQQGVLIQHPLSGTYISYVNSTVFCPILTELD